MKKQEKKGGFVQNSDKTLQDNYNKVLNDIKVVIDNYDSKITIVNYEDFRKSVRKLYDDYTRYSGEILDRLKQNIDATYDTKTYEIKFRKNFTDSTMVTAKTIGSTIMRRDTEKHIYLKKTYFETMYIKSLLKKLDTIIHEISLKIKYSSNGSSKKTLLSSIRVTTPQSIRLSSSKPPPSTLRRSSKKI